MRKIAEYASPQARELLETISAPTTVVESYRNSFLQLGKELADNVVQKLATVDTNQICVVCTVEDADFLARGILERLEEVGLTDRLRLVCYWNARVPLNEERGDSIAPIMKQYREPVDVEGSIVIVVKAIIASACTVRTNLANLLSTGNPQRVFVVAPVMYAGAEERLANEFAPEVAKKFEYLTFAVDDECEGGFVIPGVGGDVYTRLGLQDPKGEQRYLPELVPDLVKQRRTMAFNH